MRAVAVLFAVFVIFSSPEGVSACAAPESISSEWICSNVDSRTYPMLETLVEIGEQELVEVISRSGVKVVFDSQHLFERAQIAGMQAPLAVTRPSIKMVVLNEDLMNYHELGTSIVAHELQHVSDLVAGIHPVNGEACLEFEVRGTLMEGSVWARLTSPDRQVQQIERNTASVASIMSNNDLFMERMRRVYASACKL